MTLGDLFDRILQVHNPDTQDEDDVFRILHLLLWRDRHMLRIAWSK